MTTFDEREKEKYAHDEELKFKAKARRDKLLGLWARQGRRGSGGICSQPCCPEVQKDSLGQILMTLRTDFDGAGIDIPDREIDKKMDELLAIAVKEILKGKA